MFSVHLSLHMSHEDAENAYHGIHTGHQGSVSVVNGLRLRYIS